MLVKKVFKYGTGEIIPDGAIYLTTETDTVVEPGKYPNQSLKRSIYVWHYFLVEVEDTRGGDNY